MDSAAVKRAAAAAVAFGAMVTAGCGGTEGAGTGASDLVPSSVPVFVQIDTDPGSSQWKTVNSLADRFPSKQKGVNAIKKGMREQAGLDWERDVKPALGKEIDVVLLDFKNGGQDVVALTQPNDEGKFATLVAKGNAHDTSSHIVYEKFNGWELMSDSRAKIAQFEHESSAARSSLSDDASFQRAMSELGDAVARAYVNGSVVMKQIRSALRGTAVDQKFGTLGWLGASLAAASNGVQLNVIAHGTPGKLLKNLHVATYKSHLAATVPKDALVYYTFHGSGGLFAGLGVKSPLYGVPAFTGFRRVLQQIEKLIAGENALYVRPAHNARLPEITLVTEPVHGTNGMTTLDRLIERFQSQGARKPLPAVIGGEPARTVSVGSGITIDYANVGDKFVVTDLPAGIRGVQTGAKLEQNSNYRDALHSAGVPSKTQGYLYVNIHSTVPLVERLAHARVPAEVRKNLAPLRSALEYEVARSHEVEVSIFLRIK